MTTNLWIQDGTLGLVNLAVHRTLCDLREYAQRNPHTPLLECALRGCDNVLAVPDALELLRRAARLESLTNWDPEQHAPALDEAISFARVATLDYEKIELACLAREGA